MNNIKEQFNVGNVWILGSVYNLTEYFNDLVKNNKIVGVTNKEGKCCYEHGYFVCHDVWDTHIYRIQVGINSEYEEEPRTKIIETGNIRHSDLMNYCVDKYELDGDLIRKNFDVREFTGVLISQIGLKEILKSIVELDYDNGFENYDVDEFRYDEPLETLIKRIDGGYGIQDISMNEQEEDYER